MEPCPPANGNDGETWKDSDESFINKGGTWYRDKGIFGAVKYSDGGIQGPHYNARHNKYKIKTTSQL